MNVWTTTGPLVQGLIVTLAIDPAHPATLYAGIYGGVFKSMAIDSTASATAYAGTDRGMFKSMNGGTS